MPFFCALYLWKGFVPLRDEKLPKNHPFTSIENAMFDNEIDIIARTLELIGSPRSRCERAAEILREMRK